MDVYTVQVRIDSDTHALESVRVVVSNTQMVPDGWGPTGNETPDALHMETADALLRGFNKIAREIFEDLNRRCARNHRQ